MVSEPFTDSQRVRVLIAGPADLARRGILATLAADGGITVIGETSSTHGAASECQNPVRDVAFIGVSRSERGQSQEHAGLEALRATLRRNPNALVIALVDGDGVKDALRTIRLSARGTLLRNTEANALRLALQDVLDGGCALDPRLTRDLFDFIGTGTSAIDIGDAAGGGGHSLPKLSPRELEVLAGMAKGQGNKKIAAELGVSPDTVKTHASHISGKLEVSDRTVAVLYGIRSGLLDVAP